MSDLREVVRRSMRALVGFYGCYDAAAATISARWGERASCKATISKKMNGNADFNIADVIALEDAAGQFPITRMLADRLSRSNQASAVSLTLQVGTSAKEGGEAVAAALAAEHSNDKGKIAQAIVETEEAIKALEIQRDSLTAKFNDLSPQGRT